METLIRRYAVQLNPLNWRAILILLFFIPIETMANCVFQSDQQILEEISQNHPELATLSTQRQVFDSAVDEASQAPNPIINFTSNHGASSSSETTGNLLYVFELGGKQSSRVGVERAKGELGKLRSKNRGDDVLIQTSLMISRLKQVSTLISLYKESLQVFIKMRDSLKRNRQLSPEQKIQLDIVDMEVSKHRLKISDLIIEKTKLTNLIGFYAKSDCEIKLNLEAKELLAPQKIEYSQAISSDYRELEYETRWTEEKISFEKSRVYPDLKIGPSFQIEEELGQRIKRYGVSLKLDLPIINWNRGGRQRARREHRLLKTKLAFKKEENEIVIENLMATYKITFDTLGRIPKKKDLLEKHHRIERLFLRGLISIPSMIDGHDQLLSLMEDRDRHEILAQKSFLKISQFTGRLHKVLGIGETQ